MIKKFNKDELNEQFVNINWLENSGMSEEELKTAYGKLMAENYSKPILKAKAFELILEKSRIAIDIDDIFQDKVFSGNLMVGQMWQWVDEVKNKFLQEETAEIKLFWECGAGRVDCDFGHTSPNSRLLVKVGFEACLNVYKNILKNKA